MPRQGGRHPGQSARGTLRPQPPESLPSGESEMQYASFVTLEIASGKLPLLPLKGEAIGDTSWLPL